MKTLTRIAAAEALAVTVLAAILLALLYRPAPSAPSEGVIFLNAEPVDVESVSVRNGTGSYRFYYEEDGYVLDDIPGDLADLDGFVDFMTGCARLSASRQVAESGSGAEYGLDRPSAEVDIRLFDGTGLRLAVGDRERISGDCYAAVEGFEGVYLLPDALASPFLEPKTRFLSRSLTPPLAVTSPLSAIRDVTFTGGPLENPVTILATSGGGETVRLAALSFGAATHIVRGEGVYQLDQTYGIEILGSLLGIQAEEVAGYNLTEKEIAAYGFDDPWMTVEFEMVNGADASPELYTLKLAQADGDRYYALREGVAAVYLVGREAFMELEYDKLLLRWLLAPLLMDLASVEVEAPGVGYRFDIDNADPRNPVVTSDGEELDIELFRALFRLLTGAAHDGSYLGPLEQPDEEPLLAVTYAYREPDKAPDRLALYPGAARRANAFVNGAGEFAVKDLYIQRVLEGCEAVLAGGPVEENW